MASGNSDFNINGVSSSPSDDVISAREQRSHIAIIQMAPPAPSSTAASSSSSLGAKRSAAPVRGGGATGDVEQQPVNGEKKKKRHHCSVQGCVYNTPHAKDLARHMRKHTGEKPFKCDRCTKCFTRYDKLVMHIRIHEGHKSFPCPHCQYAAIDSGSLRKHMRTHTNERPYKCNICYYSTKASSQLAAHLRTHTGDSPYLCSFSGCDAAFKTSSDLKRHSRLHTGEKPFKCEYCTYCTAVKSNLNSHMKRHMNFNQRKRRSAARHNAPVEEEEDDCDSVPLYSGMGDRKTVPEPTVLPFQYACRLCDHKSDTIESFTLHTKQSHPDSSHSLIPKKRGRKQITATAPVLPPEIVDDEPSFHQCPHCNATFVAAESLHCHLRQHGTIPNKPANVNPEIYSPPPPSTRIQRYVPRPKPQLPLPAPSHSHYSHPMESEPTQETAYNQRERDEESYTLHEMQRMPVSPAPVPVAPHNSVITENPSFITSNCGSSSALVHGGRVIQRHHYDPDTGHMYVVIYNHIDDETENDSAPVNYTVP